MLVKLKLNDSKKVLLAGGLLSGFFGGLSGHQGALRSLFLMKTELAKEAFIATGVVIACMVDLTRLGVYFSGEKAFELESNVTLLLTATACAFTGAFAGRQFLAKMTAGTFRYLVAGAIFIFAIFLGIGWV
jgi:uncharacterized membrane protein YfcA